MDEGEGNRQSSKPTKRKNLWFCIALFAAIILLAWFDGGEEALHPISQEIAVPELTE